MIRAAALGFLLHLLSAGAASADTAGEFDFYVLSLSWSPTYCATEDRPDPLQCRGGARHGFVVHGLWPQYERGYPESCSTREPLRVPRDLAGTMRDIMPGTDLVGYEWRRHGTCSGLTQEDYFAATREAWEKVEIPDMLEDGGTALSARAVEQAFVAANPGLGERGIAISCRSGRLAEVRVCFTRDLEFRRCGEVDARGCKAPRLQVPAVD